MVKAFFRTRTAILGSVNSMLLQPGPFFQGSNELSEGRETNPMGHEPEDGRLEGPASFKALSNGAGTDGQFLCGRQCSWDPVPPRHLLDIPSFSSGLRVPDVTQLSQRDARGTVWRRLVLVWCVGWVGSRLCLDRMLEGGVRGSSAWCSFFKVGAPPNLICISGCSVISPKAQSVQLNLMLADTTNTRGPEL